MASSSLLRFHKYSFSFLGLISFPLSSSSPSSSLFNPQFSLSNCFSSSFSQHSTSQVSFRPLSLIGNQGLFLGQSSSPPPSSFLVMKRKSSSLPVSKEKKKLKKSASLEQFFKIEEETKGKEEEKGKEEMADENPEELSSSLSLSTSSSLSDSASLFLSTDEEKTSTTKEKKTRERKPKQKKQKVQEMERETYEGHRHFKMREKDRWLGAHVSMEGGVWTSVLRTAELHANAFALFLKSQRRWDSAPLPSEDIRLFKEKCEKFKISGDQILPHGSYLVNNGNPDPEKREKSYVCFLDDLKRCEQLGILLYNFHPGSTVGKCSREQSIAFVAEAINRAHKETEKVICVLENMAGQGNVLGGKFEDLRDIIKLVDNKDRVGVCLDTCHMFAAGYDIRTRSAFDKSFKEFGDKVGWNYLKALHLNDSKSDLGSKLDRHESIGKGKIGKDCFRFIMEDPHFRGIPMILETPEDDLWKTEIESLYDHLKEIEE